MPETITVAPYKLIDQYYSREGKCIDCDARIGVGSRYYRNLLTGEEVSTDFRSRCACWEDTDPYKSYEEPSMGYSRELDQYVYPFWDKQEQKWVRLPRQEGASNTERYVTFEK